MKMPEILAPVGGEEQLKAAVRCGADAVYLGTGRFNARRNAENFAGLSLPAAVAYAHTYGVKVHITLNTLVKDDELNGVLEEIESIAAAGADAVIVQDLAVMRLLREHVPDMPLHASTQMTVHNIDGVRAAESLGFSRVVLARELSFNEIKSIAAASSIETEVFVHGAHCMSVSGSCYLSAMLGERSGNRGLCAQPCRLNFVSGEREYALSLKDMSYIDHLAELAAAGVTSFKIEGRMKRPEYVAAAVTACRAALSGGKPDVETLRAVFSRSGFTDGYYTGRRDLKMFGTRTAADAEASSAVLSRIRPLYRRENSHIPVRMTFTASPGRTAHLEADDGSFSVAAEADEPTERAKNDPTGYDGIYAALSKCGGTPFTLARDGLEVKIYGDCFLPAARLNAMRRDALGQLCELRSAARPMPFAAADSAQTISARPEIPSEPSLRLRFSSLKQAFVCNNAQYVYLPAEELIGGGDFSAFADKIIAELPSLVFPDDYNRLDNIFAGLHSLGIKHVSADNIGLVWAARTAGFCTHGGYGLNIMNSSSLTEYGHMGLSDALASFELSLPRIKALRGTVPVGMIAYGYLPLMKFRCCPLQQGEGCRGCAGEGLLTDRLKTDFRVVCRRRFYSEMLNSVPVYIDKKDLNGLGFVVLRFTAESRDICEEITRSFIGGASFAGKRTHGLYLREVK